ncbi:transcription termination factor Rho [Candidatus Daviesbacteria bacterium]|nr:transcription termination factor Rho [Candidatus Daviesbacteria bacterium]
MPRVIKSFKPASPAFGEASPTQRGEPKEEPSADELVGDTPPAIATPDLIRGKQSSEDENQTQGNYGYRPRYGNGGYQNGDRYSNSDRDVPTEEVSGVLDIMAEGHGFLRPKYTPSNEDVYISASQIRRFQLRSGDFVEGAARPPKETERYFGLLQVNKINGESADNLVDATGRAKKRPHFEDLTAIYPNKHLKLETGKMPLSQRVIDLVAPIGFGQRGLIVSPPKAGKTSILKDLATGITRNHPEVILMAVLVGERPEEVTDLSRSIKGDVISSNFDEPAEAQTAAAEVALERAKRLVEMGKDVVILLDSITRLGRAYNLSVPPSGRTLSGGFDPVALYPPKHFFGAARNCEEGGSLTIIGTALVDTGSRMDDLIYEEFKGTGNMELHLDRQLAERRTFPAINIEASGTRQEQLLFKEEIYRQIVIMRRMISILGENERTEIFLDRLSKTESNADFLGSLKDVK